MSEEKLSEWVEWKRGQVRLGISPLPGRKSVVLHLTLGSTCYALAYFPSPDHARAVREALNSLVCAEFDAGAMLAALERAWPDSAALRQRKEAQRG